MNNVVGPRPNLDNKEIINTEDNAIYDIENALAFETVKVESAEDVVMEDFFGTTLNDYDEFDERCWNKGDGYKMPGYPQMENHLEGVETGLYLFAGESNSGKSALMMNITKDMCSYRPNKLFGVYYSLDDSKQEIIPRIIAMEQQIPIAAASKPKRFENMIADCDNDNAALYSSYLEKRLFGLDKLKKESNLFKVEDSTKIKNSTDLKNHMIKLQTFVKSIDPEMNIIVAIDSINDVRPDPKEFGKIDSSTKKIEEVSKFIKQLTVDLDIMIFASTHLRKLNGNRRPTTDDLKESNTLLFEASVVWLIFNDVSKNKGGADIYWNDSNVEGNKGAIIEIDWGKNKKSSYKGRTFTKFMPNFSLCKECSKDDGNRYDSQIYQN